MFFREFYIMVQSDGELVTSMPPQIQLRRERTEERRKMFQIVDGRRGGGGDLADKWRRLTAALPAPSSQPGAVGSDSKAQSASGEAKPETSRRKGESAFELGTTVTRPCCAWLPTLPL